MHDGMSVRPHLIYKKVHRDFTGRFSLSFDSVSLRVDDDHILRLDESFVADCWRAHDVTVRKASADVAVRGSNVVFFVDEMAETGDLRAELGFRHGRHSIAASGSFGTRRKSKRPFPQSARAQIESM